MLNVILLSVTPPNVMAPLEFQIVNSKMKYFIILKDINNHCLTGPIKWLNVYAVTQTNLIRVLLKGAQSIDPLAAPQH
jgi:hypothetical protein